MSTLYLVESDNIVLASSLINDTVNVQTGTMTPLPTRGSFVVGLPYDVPLDGAPVDVSDLITKKYTGMLASYPGYSNIIYDEQLDALGWNTSGGAGARAFGSRKTTALGGSVTSSIVTPTTTLGTSPSTIVFRWEVFAHVRTDAIADTIVDGVVEEDPNVLDGQVSFNGGGAYHSVTSGVPFEVPFADQGSSFRVQFVNTSTNRYWLHAWALLY